jgi:hypothetical protein
MSSLAKNAFAKLDQFEVSKTFAGSGSMMSTLDLASRSLERKIKGLCLARDHDATVMLSPFTRETRAEPDRL